MRFGVAIGALCLSLVGMSAAQHSAASMDVRKPTNIPAQSLGSALEAVARQRDLSVIYRSDLVSNVQSTGAVGVFTPEEALAKVLAGTGLTYRYLNETTVTIAVVLNTSQPSATNPASTPAGSSSPSEDEKQKGGGSLWDSFLVAQANSTTNSRSSTLNETEGSEQGAKNKATLEEVIVTASKRPEPLREVANSVTAFTNDQLTDLGAQSFQDYLGRAPGVVFQASTPGVANVTIRGIGTATVYPDQGQATTGIYLNDIPLTDPGFAVSVPDLDVFDVQRVEVLRGPQGTLFGSATLGGAVNYILNPVSLTKYDAVAQVGGYRTASSNDTGYTAKAAANLPLVSDVFGIRLTAIKRSDPGYLDNVGISRGSTNTHDVEAARLNALWQINSAVRLDFFSFYDRAKNGDGFYGFPVLGDLKRDTIVPEAVTFTTRVNNLKLDANLDFATLTASFADSHKSQNYLADLTPFYGSPTTTAGVASTHSDMAEVRLTSPGNQRFDWLLGAYYGWFDETYPSPTFQNNVDVFDFNVAYRSNETAAFGEATYRLNDKWRATLGGRAYDIRLRTNIVQGVPGVPATPEQSNTGSQKGTGFSPKVSLTFEPNSTVMTYGLVSKGFRMGGVNLVAPIPTFATPATYGSDHLVNYELGLRLTSREHALALDTTVFFIDWTDIQLRLNRPDGFSYVANAGAARSKGVENSISWKPTQGLSLQTSLTYLEAALAQSLNLGNGTTLPDGARLPGASKWSSSESVSYQYSGRLSPHNLVSHRFVSSAHSDFSSALPIGNYQLFDARGGVNIGTVGINAFINNIADRRGVTAAAFFGTPVTDFYVTPRTIGLEIDWHL